jgi:hypothetical protein
MNRPIYGNPATTPNPVADFNQNNPKKADYIKNRPFYESITEIGTTTTDSSVGQSIVSFDIDSLAVGDNICYEVTCDGNTTKGSFILEDCDDMPKRAGNNYSYMWNDNGFISLIDVCDGTCDSHVRLYRLDGVKQLDEKFIPDRIKYTYVTDKKLGEAVPMIGDTTTLIGLDEELNTGDMIMVKGYFNDGTSESYVVEVGEIGGDYGGRIDADVGRLDNVHVPISTAVTFQSEVKGEVYKLNKKLISEATTELYNIVKEIDEALDRVIEKYGLGDDSGDGGFVMPEGAFAITPHIPIEKGLYQFVCFEKENGEIIAEIPEHYDIQGGIGTDIELDSQSAGLSHDYPYLTIDNDTTILGGFDRLTGDYTLDFEEIKGTTYVVKVG